APRLARSGSAPLRSAIRRGSRHFTELGGPDMAPALPLFLLLASPVRARRLCDPTWESTFHGTWGPRFGARTPPFFLRPPPVRLGASAIRRGSRHFTELGGFDMAPALPLFCSSPRPFGLGASAIRRGSRHLTELRGTLFEEGQRAFAGVARGVVA